MEAVNAVDNPTTKKWKTRQDTIDQEDIITNGQRTMKYHTLVNNHTWSASTHQQSASGRQNRATFPCTGMAAGKNTQVYQGPCNT